MVLGAVKIVRFLYQKTTSKSGNKGIKIGQKSGNSVTDFLLKSSNARVVIIAFSYSVDSRLTLKSADTLAFSKT